jgi:aryl-alcohol dehydrogenase-like predicted oxidoreductase
MAHNLALVDGVTALAQGRGCTPAQLALAWLLSRGPHVVPIPGTRHTSRLDENAEAAHLELTAQELVRIDMLLAAVQVAGTRYPEAAMASLNL